MTAPPLPASPSVRFDHRQHSDAWEIARSPLHLAGLARNPPGSVAWPLELWQSETSTATKAPRTSWRLAAKPYGIAIVAYCRLEWPREPCHAALTLHGAVRKLPGCLQRTENSKPARGAHDAGLRRRDNYASRSRRQ
ncbi:unnamed protein product [Lampetra fluviatilis]